MHQLLILGIASKLGKPSQVKSTRQVKHEARKAEDKKERQRTRKKGRGQERKRRPDASLKNRDGDANGRATHLANDACWGPNTEILTPVKAAPSENIMRIAPK
ncbi:unnamed protein product [[Candida] boidinii]|uniref:Unnamed protein product n=1 Tax=Candida boidinii TaxID=5477 RepID=A0A9W6T4K4_CANBO|nr:hypothetical protein B5S30_g4568 [[Candida] boidinii]GME75546.1 unnamed protein product [[Candida] boidinii]GMF63220.1 unnamed protein product [[Candida] boidinii]GMF97709.1 unnamed protein product [[Candida] boidinii]